MSNYGTIIKIKATDYAQIKITDAEKRRYFADGAAWAAEEMLRYCRITPPPYPGVTKEQEKSFLNMRIEKVKEFCLEALSYIETKDLDPKELLIEGVIPK